MPTAIPLAQHAPTLLFLTATLLTASLVNRIHPTPYIDEIFHIPQAQRFCSALTHARAPWHAIRAVDYDPKLTTPPGLYLLSAALARVLPGWRCNDVVWLRTTNLVLLLTMPSLIARILMHNQHRSEPALPRKEQPTQAKKQTPVPRDHIRALQHLAKQQPASRRVAETSAEDEHVVPVSATSIARPGAVRLPVGPRRSEASVYIMASACTVALLPPLWFFGFLYYTDVASVWLVLAAIVLFDRLTAAPSLPALGGAAAVALIAVLVRQTNLVWIGFAAAQSSLAALRPLSGASCSPGLFAEASALVSLAFGRSGRRRFWRTVAWNVAAMLPVLAAGAWFVAHNGSIVLGDKANHAAGMHFAQLGYVLLFATAFGLPSLILSLGHGDSGVLSTVRRAVAVVGGSAFGSVKRTVRTAVVAGLFWAAVEYGTIEHPFLLADNRHYTFYARRILQRPLPLPQVRVQPRLVAVPLYVAALHAWGAALAQRTSALRTLLLAMATAAVLVPSPLVEPRYFVVPYVLLRIYTQPTETACARKWVFLATEAAVLVAINAATVGLFVSRPFEWDKAAVDQARNEATTMRFIW